MEEARDSVRWGASGDQVSCVCVGVGNMRPKLFLALAWGALKLELPTGYSVARVFLFWPWASLGNACDFSLFFPPNLFFPITISSPVVSLRPAPEGGN